MNKNCTSYLRSVLTNFNIQWPAVLFSHGTDFRHWVSQVRGEWSVDMGLQLGKETEPWSRNPVLLKLTIHKLNRSNIDFQVIYYSHV